MALLEGYTALRNGLKAMQLIARLENRIHDLIDARRVY